MSQAPPLSDWSLSQIDVSLKSVGLFQSNGDCWVLLSIGFGVLDLRCFGFLVMARFWSHWVYGCQTCYLKKNMFFMFFQQDNKKKIYIYI